MDNRSGNAKTQEEILRERYSCLYCGRPIRPEEILFAMETNDWHKDKNRYRFLSVRDYPLEKGDEFRTVYLPVHAGTDVVMDDHNFPSTIRGYRSSCMTPEELDTWVEAGRPARESSPEEDETMRVFATRACPHCHCTLPREFGRWPTVNICMFGGRAAGKTAYLISLWQQLNPQLSNKHLGACQMLPESLVYWKEEEDYYRNNGVTKPTPKTAGLFPMVLRYTNNLSGESRSVFVVFNDIAGEGTADSNYLFNHVGIQNAQILMLMIDPNQLNNGAYSDAVSDAVNAEEAEHDCCRDTVDLFAATALQLCTDVCSGVRSVITVLTKLDLPLDVEKQRWEGSILWENGMDDHVDALDPKVIQRVQTELGRFVDYKRNRQPGTNSLVNDIRGVFRQMGHDINVCLLGVSTHTRNKQTGAFEAIVDERAPKHRITEPFLVAMTEVKMIPVKGEGPQTNGQSRKPAGRQEEPQKDSGKKRKFLFFR